MADFFKKIFSPKNKIDNVDISSIDPIHTTSISTEEEYLPTVSVLPVIEDNSIKVDDNDTPNSIVKHETKEQNFDDGYLILGASIIGKYHVVEGSQCQDCHKYKYLGDGWGIAIVSDGAGSASNAQRGSNAICNIGLGLLDELITTYKNANKLPEEKEWALEARAIFEMLKEIFVKTAESESVDHKTFNATALMLIYTPLGMLVAHIGDGRMGYMDSNYTWHALITPHSGEEASQTIFVTSDWNILSNLKMSDVYIPETRIVRDYPKAFILMSDGCENATWECNVLNSSTNKYEDANKPFERFLTPMVDMILEKENLDDRFQTFVDIIDKGNSVFEKETDDKTILLGLLNL